VGGGVEAELQGAPALLDGVDRQFFAVQLDLGTGPETEDREVAPELLALVVNVEVQPVLQRGHGAGNRPRWISLPVRTGTRAGRAAGSRALDPRIGRTAGSGPVVVGAPISSISRDPVSAPWRYFGPR
jgi:hypothetical protein